MVADAPDMADFVRTRSNVHLAYITETERTRRVAIVCAAGLVAFAAGVAIFAPQDREQTALVCSAVLLCAAGAFGYKSITLRTKSFELSARGADEPNARRKRR
jgi:hypothetical protein